MTRWLAIFFGTIRDLLRPATKPRRLWLCEGCNRVIYGMPIFFADEPYHDTLCMHYRKYGRYD